MLMGMVDAKYRFMWASCRYPGNSHDSIIIVQSTTLWKEIAQGKILPGIAKNVGGVDVPPLIVGDSAFSLPRHEFFFKRALYPEMLTKRVERGKLLYFHGGWQPYGQYSCSANGLKLRFSRAH